MLLLTIVTTSSMVTNYYLNYYPNNKIKDINFNQIATPDELIT